MREQDCDIKEFPDEAAARRAGYHIPIPAGEVDAVRGMNRKARRKWLAERKREKRKAGSAKGARQ